MEPGWEAAVRLHLLRSLQENGEGHLWGIEADKTIYDRMMANVRRALPEALPRFTPLFGYSQDVIPDWLAQHGPAFQIDVAFLDGGNNPGEQIREFELLDSRMPVGALLLAHDARVRKGKWLVPYLAALDHWESRVLDTSEVGLLYARKLRLQPSRESLQAARRLLRRLRLQPAELAAAYLPSAVCGLILRLLPKGLSRRISDGAA